MHVRRKRQRQGRRRDRTYQRLAYEAGVDYLLSMMRLPQHTRVRYAKALGERGFDLPSQDMRSTPAPKPCFLHDTMDGVR